MQIILQNIHTRASAFDVDDARDIFRVDQAVEQLIAGTHAVADLDPKLVDRLIEEASGLMTTGIRREYFRGRYDGKQTLTSTEFGPPPLSSSPARYKFPGEMIWYAGWNPRTVRAELHAPGAISVQRFRVDVPDVRVLRALPDHSQTAPAFHHLLTKSESHDENSYRASLLVREIAHRLGADAMEYPSVRVPYSADREGVNLVAWGTAATTLCAVPEGEPEHLP